MATELKKSVVYECKICHRKFYNTHLQLNAHMRTHKRRRIKPNEQPSITNAEKKKIKVKEEKICKIKQEKPHIVPIEVFNEIIRNAMDFDVERIKQSKVCQIGENIRQQIIDYTKDKIKNGEVINCQSIQTLFGLTEPQIESLWSVLMDLVEKETFFYCIDAYLSNEMTVKGNLNHIDSSTLEQIFKCSQEEAFQILNKWVG